MVLVMKREDKAAKDFMKFKEGFSDLIETMLIIFSLILTWLLNVQIRNNIGKKAFLFLYLTN